MTTQQAAEAVDLTTCDREPIHLISAIQPIGFLVAISADWQITRASANAKAFLGRPAEALVGTSLRAAISAAAEHTIRNLLAALHGGDAIERTFGLVLQEGGPRFDVAVHMAGHDVVIEAEPSEPPAHFTSAATVRSMLGWLNGLSDLGDILGEAVRQVWGLTGYDRVMIYRFHPDDSGEVVAERARAGLEPYLGLRYPASDIPRQARSLFTRNIVRVVADIAAAPCPIVPQFDPAGAPLDLSMSTLRAHAPVHIEYLRNMGVQATLTLSLVQGGRLWGLVACHHMAPHPIGYERRTAAELFAQVLALLIECRERAGIAEYEHRARHMNNWIMAALDSMGPTAGKLASLADRMTQIVPCDGYAVRIGDETILNGHTPTREQIMEVTRFLEPGGPDQVFATAKFGRDYAAARNFAAQAAGMLAIPITSGPRDYLMFFRRELAREVTWAGDPTKPVELGPNGARLSPRRSFEAWREIVRGQSAPWTEPEQRAAEDMRVTFLAVVLRVTNAAVRVREAAAAQLQDQLIAELNHRVRNILGLIRGLVSQSKDGAADVEAFATIVGNRVQALARAHDQITQVHWGPGSLATMLATEVSAYLNDNAKQVQYTGPPVLLQPKAFATIALIVHEMVTNSAKYGALSNSAGLISIDWALEPSGDLVMGWREHDGPPVRPPLRRGFGSTIIERSLPHDLGGSASIEYDQAGVQARFVVPAAFVSLGIATVTSLSVEAPAGAVARLSGPVLLVEDSMIIAMAVEAKLMSLGASRVDTAATVREALRLLDLALPSFAILDVNLGTDETSFPVAARLRELGVPWVFATGYGEELVLPPEFAGRPIITKPYVAAAIAGAAWRAGLRT